MQTVWGYKSSVLDEKRNNHNKGDQFLPKDISPPPPQTTGIETKEV